MVPPPILPLYRSVYVVMPLAFMVSHSEAYEIIGFAPFTYTHYARIMGIVVIPIIGHWHNVGIRGAQKMADFEKAFGDFLDSDECDRAEDAVFSLMRAVFRAGWIAAGGALDDERKIVELKNVRGCAPSGKCHDGAKID